MAVKIVTAPAPAKSANPYPWIGLLLNSDLLVLFTARDAGVVLRDANRWSYGVGHYSEEWEEADFVSFAGSVTLSNEAA